MYVALYDGISNILLTTNSASANVSYPKTDAPKYSTGHAINFAWCMMMVGTAAIMHFHLKSVNRKRAAIMAGRGLPTAEEKAEHQDEGDNAPWFVYTT